VTRIRVDGGSGHHDPGRQREGGEDPGRSPSMTETVLKTAKATDATTPGATDDNVQN
jgi:hypothetical protein